MTPDAPKRQYAAVDALVPFVGKWNLPLNPEELHEMVYAVLSAIDDRERVLVEAIEEHRGAVMAEGLAPLPPNGTVADHKLYATLDRIQGQERPLGSPSCVDCDNPACALVAGQWYCLAHVRDLAQRLVEAARDLLESPLDGHSAVQHDPECEICQRLARLWAVLET